MVKIKGKEWSVNSINSSQHRVISILIFAILACVALAVAFVERTTAGPQSSELALLKEAVMGSHKAFSSRDISAMGKIWMKTDYVSAIHPSGQKPFLGWEKVRQSWLQSFAHNRDIKVESLAGDAHVVGDTAWVIDSTRIEGFQTQTGQPILMDNVLGTKIFQRVGSDWLLVHWHTHLPNFKPVVNAHDLQMNLELTDEPPKDELDNLNQAFYQAFMDRNIVAMASIWSEEDQVSAFHPDYSVPFLDIANVLTSFDQIFANLIDISVSKGHPLAKHVVGDLAWLIDSREIAGTRVDTKERITRANVIITKIFQRQNGAWRLVHYHAHNGPSLPDEHGHEHDH